MIHSNLPAFKFPGQIEPRIQHRNSPVVRFDEAIIFDDSFIRRPAFNFVNAMVILGTVNMQAK